jgi:hypothetical protein
MCARLFVKGAAEMVLDLCTQQVLTYSAADRTLPHLSSLLLFAIAVTRHTAGLQTRFPTVASRWGQTAG